MDWLVLPPWFVCFSQFVPKGAKVSRTTANSHKERQSLTNLTTSFRANSSASIGCLRHDAGVMKVIKSQDIGNKGVIAMDMILSRASVPSFGREANPRVGAAPVRPKTLTQPLRILAVSVRS